MILVMASSAFASALGTVHEKAIIADSPDDLKKAHDIFEDGDQDSFIQMMRAGQVIVMAKDKAIQVDDVNAFEGWIKFHFRGRANVTFYVAIDDADVAMPQ
jgi:hypothetical protein